MIDRWRRNIVDDWSERAYISAVITLDFSAISDKDSWSLQNEYVLLLKEILDRIELPPYNEIPGDDEVARGVTEWTIPNTRITIAQVKHGPRAGEFLFSAGTVERLFRSYRLVKDLPYKPTASTPGIYEEYIKTGRTILDHERQLRILLRRVDTSSPRSTLRVFLENVNRAHVLVMDADKALRAQPPTMTRQQAREIERTADDLLRRATATLDLSQVPAAHIKAASLELALKLKEVLDRTVLPGVEAIPDALMVAAWQQESQSSVRGTRPFRWTYPNTDIEIVEIMEGERQGEFLFSARTVRQISDFFEKLRSLPYRSEISRVKTSKYAWSEVSEGFYDHVYTNAGYLVSGVSFLGGFVDVLPGGFKKVYGGMTVWEWITLLCFTLAGFLAVWVILRVLRLLAGRLHSPLDGWLMILAPTLIMFIVLVVDYFINKELNISGSVRTVITTAREVILIILVIWAVTRLFTAIAETVIASPRLRDRSSEASLLRITVRIIAFLIGGWIFVVSVRNLGADLVPLLAGLGVGGLAVALAAQKTLANFIGSLILFANKPVKPGDFCRYGDQVGTVERIGLLSTRIRSLERTIVTVPNAEFSEMKLDNFAERDRRLLKTVLQLRYETTSEQLRYILVRLRKLLLGHPKVDSDPARVRFVGYGAYSKDVEIFSYLRCQDQDTFLAIQEDLLLRMEDIINAAGSGFAFPSQTAYLSRDKGLDSKRGSDVKAQVKEWRVRGKLPFPQFEAAEREQLKDILDYPPEGSPDYEPSRASVARQPERGSSTLSTDDFVDLPSFAAKLHEPDQVANYLWGHLSARTRKLLSNYRADADNDVREALVEDLNAIIHGPSIYAVDRFSEIKLRQETQDLLDRNPQGEDLARLNRLLLEDAYPLQVSRNPGT
ncbi:MAG: mechanosensitive ion channel [Nitrospiraceae bacterium]|nr:MAG: mechanosensitive ion channel [Nitrospiraceae bacterium]